MDSGSRNQNQTILHIVIPFLPPTSNHAYVTNRKTGARFLTKEGKAFKQRAITQINSEYLAAIGSLDRTALYSIWYAFYFSKDEILNTTFGQKGGAASRYKKMDVENRLKLVADSFSTAVGIDDSQFFQSGCSKLNADLLNGKPQVHIFFQSAKPEIFGL